MRRSMCMARSLALVAVCLCVFVPPALAQDCPVLAGSVPGEPGYGIALSGSYALVGRSEESSVGGGLDVYDVSDPTAPTLLGSLDASWFGHRIAVSGQYAYVAADSYNGLRVVDISDPAVPMEVGGLGGYAISDVAVSESHAYAALFGTAFGVIDLSTPIAPVFISYLTVPATAVAVSGDYAYVAGGSYFSDDLFVIDVRDPDSPSVVAALPLDIGQCPVRASAVTVAGGYAYVGATCNPGLDFHVALFVVDATEAAASHVVGAIDLPAVGFSVVQQVVVSGEYAYVPVLGSGAWLFVVTVADPASPALAGEVYPLYSRDAAVSGGFVYTPDFQLPPSGDGGLEVFRECAVGVFADGFDSGDTSAWSATVP